MRKRWNLCFFVALLIVISLAMSACVQSDNVGKQNPVQNNGQTEDEKEIPTLDEILKEESPIDEEDDNMEEHPEEDFYEEGHSEDEYQDEYYEEEP